MSKFNNELDGSHVAVVIEPSPQRLRRYLTREERERVIRAYDECQKYTQVAKMFNCSWERIKNIVASRDCILEATCDENDETRKCKLAYLAECMYEYIQRAQYHRRTIFSALQFLNKAREFCDLIQIDKFVPNKSWLHHFKTTYNIPLPNRLITFTRIPPFSLDLKDIMTYCNKNKSHNVELVMIPTATQKTGQEGEVPTRTPSDFVTRRKINLMEHALYEYLQRVAFHQHVTPDYDRVRNLAIQLLKILGIEGFFPGKTWLKHFENRFNFQLSHGVLVKHRTPPLSLDLREIIRYCSRNDFDQSPATVTLTTKENSEHTALREMCLETSKDEKSKTSSIKLVRPMDDSAVLETNYQSDDDDVMVVEGKQELIVIKDDDDNENENGDIAVLNNETQDAADCDRPPLKIPKVETLTWSEHSSDNDADAQEPLPNNIQNYKDALRLLKCVQEYATLVENYRVIELISELEKNFKNQPETIRSDNNDEDNDSNL